MADLEAAVRCMEVSFGTCQRHRHDKAVADIYRLRSRIRRNAGDLSCQLDVDYSVRDTKSGGYRLHGDRCRAGDCACSRGDRNDRISVLIGDDLAVRRHIAVRTCGECDGL